ncbi:MAG: hypothetical protein LLF94_00350 [Chlamydiales bacterium]|nr:hypothetical protein [Chlamydiales bacterium]
MRILFLLATLLITCFSSLQAALPSIIPMTTHRKLEKLPHKKLLTSSSQNSKKAKRL